MQLPHPLTPSHAPRSSDFLPLEYSTVRGVEEQVLEERAALEGYTRLHAQHSYIHACASMQSFGAVFFPCKVTLATNRWCSYLAMVQTYSP